MDIQEINERIHTLEKELVKLYELKMNTKPHVIETGLKFVWNPAKPNQITVNDGTKNVDLCSFAELVKYIESFDEDPFRDFTNVINGLME